MLAASVRELQPSDRYLMGLVRGSWSRWPGIDLFDCVLPTRVAAEAQCTQQGRINATASVPERDRPIEPDCDCLTCATYPLLMYTPVPLRELLGYRLASIHNLRFSEADDAMRSAIGRPVRRGPHAFRRVCAGPTSP
jgi:tRNA-guanine family transglycosylase